MVSILNDFLSFEVGGRDKSFEQSADLPHSYILADGIEHPIGNSPSDFSLSLQIFILINDG